VTVLNRYAFELKSSATPSFTVTPAWRAELRRRLSAAGIAVESGFEPAATSMLDRELDRRVSRLLLGDAGARKRSLAEDEQLSRAVALLSAARSQDALFSAAQLASAANTRPLQRSNDR
jgi:hypothetical protein